MLRLLRQFGIEEVRCEFEYGSAGEGQKFVRVASDVVDRLRALVPCIPKTSMPRPMPRYPEGRGNCVTCRKCRVAMKEVKGHIFHKQRKWKCPMCARVKMKRPK